MNDQLNGAENRDVSFTRNSREIRHTNDEEDRTVTALLLDIGEAFDERVHATGSNKSGHGQALQRWSTTPIKSSSGKIYSYAAVADATCRFKEDVVLETDRPKQIKRKGADERDPADYSLPVRNCVSQKTYHYLPGNGCYRKHKRLVQQQETLRNQGRTTSEADGGDSASFQDYERYMRQLASIELPDLTQIQTIQEEMKNGKTSKDRERKGSTRRLGSDETAQKKTVYVKSSSANAFAAERQLKREASVFKNDNRRKSTGKFRNRPASFHGDRPFSERRDDGEKQESSDFRDTVYSKRQSNVVFVGAANISEHEERRTTSNGYRPVRTSAVATNVRNSGTTELRSEFGERMQTQMRNQLVRASVGTDETEFLNRTDLNQPGFHGRDPKPPLNQSAWTVPKNNSNRNKWNGPVSGESRRGDGYVDTLDSYGYPSFNPTKAQPKRKPYKQKVHYLVAMTNALSMTHQLPSLTATPVIKSANQMSQLSLTTDRFNETKNDFLPICGKKIQVRTSKNRYL